MTRMLSDHDNITDTYPTRLAEKRAMFERMDPVVYGNESAGPLSGGQLKAYTDNGFVFFPGFFKADELAPHVGALDELRTREDMREREEVIIEPSSNEVRSIFDIHRGSDCLAELCRDPRIVRIARQLLGSDVYIHHSRINYKPGIHGREFYWHSDFETWHAEDGMPRMRAVSCTISLTPNHEFNGPLMVVPGSHRYFVPCLGETPAGHYRESLRSQFIGVPDPGTLATLVDEGGIETLMGPVGSVVFFECNVMHGSNSNITPYPRSNVFLVFNSVENTLAEPFAASERRPEWISNRRDVTPLTVEQSP